MKKLIRKTLYVLALPIFCAITMIDFAYAISDAEAQVIIFKYISMAASVSLSCLASGWALSKTGPASSATIVEKPELFGRTIIYVGMAEGIAVYGLLIAFLIWLG